MWEIVVGLEVHAQVVSKFKLFSYAKNDSCSVPNENVNLFDISMPGTLPIINYHIVDQAIRTGLALDGSISRDSQFDRKSYFYPDLPHGFQISQFYHPIVRDAVLRLKSEKEIKIREIHLESDAGKSIHVGNKSLIDLNRAGVPLMEIVSEPDMRSTDEVVDYIEELISVLKYINTCDCNMETGSLRIDANISVMRSSDQQFGERCEIKNLNSIKNVIKAIESEFVRQVAILDGGGVIHRQTMLYDEENDCTVVLRDKEDAADYRYAIEPDLLSVFVTEDKIKSIASTLPELPAKKRSRYINDVGMSPYDASVLVSDKDNALFFDSVLSEGCGSTKLAISWFTTEFFGILNKKQISVSNCGVTAKHFASLLSMIHNQSISGKIGKTILAKMFESGKSPLAIVEEDGLLQISDEKYISDLIDQILLENNAQVQKYKEGNTRLLAFFVGKIMANTSGKANPRIVNKLLLKKLDHC